MKYKELIEGKINKFNTVTVYENPSPRQLYNLFGKTILSVKYGDEHSRNIMRFIVDVENQLYVWDAYDGTHAEVQKILGITLDGDDPYAYSNAFKYGYIKFDPGYNEWHFKLYTNLFSMTTLVKNVDHPILNRFQSIFKDNQL